MQLPDVNVLVYAFRADAPRHDVCRRWLEQVTAGDGAFAYAELVLSGFLRIVTHQRVFRTPTPVEEALVFAEAVRAQPHSVRVAPGPRHWSIFTSLCERAQVKGNLVPDAYFAALAIESGSEWVTMDRDFSRFPDLHYWHPDQQTSSSEREA